MPKESEDRGASYQPHDNHTSNKPDVNIASNDEDFDKSKMYDELGTSDGYPDTTSLTTLQRFYSGANVLVTGATGFMGKVLIEKLLRSCPDINAVYMIVRERKGRGLDERIEDIVAAPCFDRIKKERPEFRSKLHAVAGDIGLKGLGISAEDTHLLQLQIDIVFHVAATVRFDEHLQLAILQNVRGTKEILDLSRTFSNLRCFVHVSSVYSNCQETQIDERFYKPQFPCDHAISLAESTDTVTLDRLSHKLLGKWPNSYSFTKALSEDVIRTHGQGLPVAVFRPSVVVCTNSEPIAGWIDNLYGPTGVFVMASAGLLRTANLNENIEANAVPCDMVINALIASAWDVAANRTSQDIPVYNYISPSENKLIWKETLNFIQANSLEWPTIRSIWYWSFTSFTNRLVYLVYRMFVHFLPALLMDFFFLATNKKPRMMRMYSKIHRFLDVIAYFGVNQWGFEDRNVVELWEKLGQLDREKFFFDMRSLNWETFLEDCFPGMRTYLLKDPPHTLPAAKIKMRRLYLLHRCTQCVLAGLVIWLSTVALSRIFSAYSKQLNVDSVDKEAGFPSVI